MMQIYALCHKADGKRWAILEALMPCRIGEGRVLEDDVPDRSLNIRMAAWQKRKALKSDA